MKSKLVLGGASTGRLCPTGEVLEQRSPSVGGFCWCDQLSSAWVRRVAGDTRRPCSAGELPGGAFRASGVVAGPTCRSCQHPQLVRRHVGTKRWMHNWPQRGRATGGWLAAEKGGCRRQHGRVGRYFWGESTWRPCAFESTAMAQPEVLFLVSGWLQIAGVLGKVKQYPALGPRVRGSSSRFGAGASVSLASTYHATVDVTKTFTRVPDRAFVPTPPPSAPRWVRTAFSPGYATDPAQAAVTVAWVFLRGSEVVACPGL